MRIKNLISRGIERQYRRFSPIYRGKIAINWHISSNFGDLLAVYIAKKLSGLEVFNAPINTSSIHYQVVGSILSCANKKSLIWGSGFANKTDNFNSFPKEIYMLRGAYSLERCIKLGLKGEVTLGDPGYIISHLYNRENIVKKYELGVIAHWVDYELCREIFKNREDVYVMKLLNNDVEFTIDRILECKQCISSSLHGLIVAHSYGIPAMHVTFSDHVLNTGLKKYFIQGDGTKFLDYFSSVNIAEYTPIEITSIDMIRELIDYIPQDCGNKAQINKILSSCPFADRTKLDICQ